jgi:hypothetical protein
MGDAEEPAPRRPDVPPPPPGVGGPLARAVLFVPAALALVVPFFGPLVAWLSPKIAVPRRDLAWPGSSRRTVLLAALATPAVIWASLILFPGGAFLLVPLCAPSSLVGWLVPSVVGTLVYGAGCAVSVRLGWPWVWPIAGVAGAASFSIASLLLVDELVC